MRGRTLSHIFELIENLEREVALLKILIQEAVRDEEIGHDILVANVAYLESTDQDSILVDAEIIEDDTKPPAKVSKKEKFLEARRSVREWIIAEEARRRQRQDHTQEESS
jgi:predicted amino acid racemase